MLPEIAQEAVQNLIVAISGGEFVKALAMTDKSRCSAGDLSRVIRKYGRSLIAPPFAPWDIVDLAGSCPRGWSLRVPLWSEEEGRSDLEVRLTIRMPDEVLRIELDDVLVA